METTNNPLILIIDDEEAILKTLKDALTDESYRVETLADGRKALDLIGKLIPDLVLLDIFMPKCNGLQLLAQIQKEYPDQKVIIISGFGTIPIAIEAVQKGAIDFIEKPLNLDEILSKIEFLKSEVQPAAPTPQEIDNAALQACNIIGQSSLFLELIGQTERLAPYTFPILIHGEPGTGKTALARYIHKKSNLAGGSFEIINCETLTDNSCEKIFADAFFKSPKTVCVTHIDTLSPVSQNILLAALQQKNDNVRIIASSTTPLFTLVQQKKFNTSLFAYLNKAPLEVPPLRKRPYDIPLLVSHYIKAYNNKHKKRIVLTTQSLRLLRNQRWQPSNISQLKQVLENLVIHSEQDHAVVSPQELTRILGEQAIVDVAQEQSLLRFDSLDQATTAFTKSFLVHVLKKHHFNIDAASGQLNLSPMQFKNKLLELKISTHGCGDGGS